MKQSVGSIAAAGVMLAMLAVAGCIERKERLQIEADGRVQIEVLHQTDSHSEMYLGDPVPTLDQGWIVEEWTELDEDAKERFHLRARASFPPDVALPSNYASLRDPEPEVALQFPTSLVIEERNDGTYYHFRRVYRARPWAFIDNPARLVQEQVKEVVDDREFEDIPIGDRAAIVRALVDLEVLKLSAFARQAMLDVTPDAPQDVWLIARASIRRAAEALDIERFVELLEGNDDPANAEAIDDQSRAFQDDAVTGMRLALLETGYYGQPQLKALGERFDHYQRYHEITDELGDDNFTIEVEMPGEIVGHNGADLRGRTVTWSFNGQLIRDRDHELLATSRVPF